MCAVSLRNLATKDVLDKIQHGEISASEIITESQICDSLGISRTPVRESLIELVANGILEKIPRKGYRVCNVNNKHKLDSFVILGELDALAAKLAVDSITAKDIKRMNETIDIIDIAIKYKNYSSYCELQEKFHHIYIDKCDNEQLIRILEEIKAGVSRYTYYSEDPDKLFDLCHIMNNEHRQIVHLFEKRNGAALADFLANTHWITKYPDMI